MYKLVWFQGFEPSLCLIHSRLLSRLTYHKGQLVKHLSQHTTQAYHCYPLFLGARRTPALSKDNGVPGRVHKGDVLRDNSVACPILDAFVKVIHASGKVEVVWVARWTLGPSAAVRLS